MLMRRSPGRRLRTALPLLAALVVLGPLGWMWASSFVPSEYTATEMGYVDDGGVPVPGGHDHGDSSGGVPVASLTGDVDGPADVAVTLVARQERFRLATGEEVDGYTLNGTSPGPTLHVAQGSCWRCGWSTSPSPAAPRCTGTGSPCRTPTDGVAGVTQDAVPVGGSHVYRFRPGRAGTYWYHAHQLSHEQVERGLLGALVVDPPGTAVDEATDVVALTHLYAGRAPWPGAPATCRCRPSPDPLRIRVINTDNGPIRTWVDGSPFRVLAVDGTTSTSPPRSAPRRSTSPPVGGWTSRWLLPATGAVRVTVGGVRAARRAARRPGAAAVAATGGRGGPAALRHPGAARVRPGRPRPAASPTPSAAARASSTAVPGCGGR